ncbi:basic secretory protein-like protein [Pseudoxanthomonas sp. JBR18]|uniref:basic secretory protein-like protein n=1 Tax=Pseudoxanthomonas sp. JBR18 TaxID=2969308 RepID=UPI002305EDA4|nr:basic secretory protein-like protein [Pseudoxanthomonas sp. JBR18]WCE06191.1 basic secretory protein-like protein [Pseudoxanthomonas sp. JBR18]
MSAMPRPLASALFCATLLVSVAAQAREDVTRTQDGVTITYRDASGALDTAMQEKILETFFHAYARERADFNTAAPTKAIITIDPSYDGIAYVSSDDWAKMTINPAWLVKHPGDTDLVSHEAMHIVQSYPDYGNDQAPTWLVEGIADYARDRYGVDNAAGGWALPTQIKDKQHYDTGYRVSGAFLKWADAKHPGLVKQLDAALRGGTYSPQLWTQATGETVETLWDRYVIARGGVRPANG